MTSAAATPPSIAAIGLVKDEADIIGSTLQHLYQLGIRRYVIADNGSTDETPALVERFAADHPAATVVIMGDPVERNLQSQKITALAHFAHHYFDVDFVYPFDADEFLVPPEAILPPGDVDHPATIQDLLHGADWDYLTLDWITCIADGPQGLIAMDPGPEAMSKILLRWREDLSITQGQHGVVVDRPSRWIRRLRKPRRAQTSWRVLHLPVRSAAQLRSKIIRSAFANRDNRGDWGTQSRALHAAFQREGEMVFTNLFDLISRPDASAVDLEGFARRFGVERATLAYFQDFFGPRARIAFRVPMPARTALAA